jgi:hypothetical protein
MFSNMIPDDCIGVPNPNDGVDDDVLVAPNGVVPPPKLNVIFLSCLTFI